MLTTPYKVLIACSSLLLLAALGYRATDLFSAPGPPGPLVAVDPDAADAADARPPNPAADAALASQTRVSTVPVPLPPPPKREPLPPTAPGDMTPLDEALAAVVPPTPPAPDDGVPTLTIGRKPGEDPRLLRAPEEPPAAPDAASPDDEQAPRVYVVQPGDSLQRIAARTLGDANRWGSISSLNPGVDPLRLQVGDRLTLPAPPEGDADATPAASPLGASSGVTAAIHEVKAGDSLSVIALRYYGDSTRWKTIYEANRDRMDSPDDLGIGVELRIPPRDEVGR